MGFPISKGVGFGTEEVGVRQRFIIFVGSGSFCSLQLCFGGAALLPAAQKLTSI